MVTDREKDEDLNSTSTTSVHCASWENGSEEYGRKKDFQFNSQARTFVPHDNQYAQVTNVSSVDDNQGKDPDHEQSMVDLGDEMPQTEWQWSKQNDEVTGDLIPDQSPRGWEWKSNPRNY